MTTQTGKIHSSNYPNMYDNHDDCAWLIEVDRNHVVQLSFEVGNFSAFVPKQGCLMAKLDPFLSLDFARVEGVGGGGAIQGKEGIKFCSEVYRSHSPESRRAKHIQSKNPAIAIWQPWFDVEMI